MQLLFFFLYCISFVAVVTVDVCFVSVVSCCFSTLSFLGCAFALVPSSFFSALRVASFSALATWFFLVHVHFDSSLSSSVFYCT